jgi:hypothetical protein
LAGENAREREGGDLTTTVYRFYDAESLLLYVGVSNSPLTRWNAHLEKTWWPEVARIAVEHFPTRAEALDAEEEAIADELPLYNAETRGIVDRGLARRMRRSPLSWHEIYGNG